MKILLVFSLLLSFAVEAEITSAKIEAVCEAALSSQIRTQLREFSQEKNSAQLHQLRVQVIAALKKQLPGLSMDLISEAANHVLNSIMQGANTTGEALQGSDPPPGRRRLQNIDLSDLIKDIVSRGHEKKSVVIIFKDGDLVCLGEQTHCEGFAEAKTSLMENGAAIEGISSNLNFVAVTNTGKVFCLGRSKWIKSCEKANEFLKQTEGATHFTKIYSTNFAFAALTNNGKIFWGYDGYSRHRENQVNDFLARTLGDSHITQVVATDHEFASLTRNGKIFCWGQESQRENCKDAIRNFLKYTKGATFFTQIISSKHALAALTDNGKLFCWGDDLDCDDYKNRASKFLKKTEGAAYFTQIYSSERGFAALSSNGKLFCWGKLNSSTNCDNLNSLLFDEKDHIDTIMYTKSASVVKTKKGHAYIWGKVGGTIYNTLTKFEGPFLNSFSHGHGILLQKQDLSYTALGFFDQDILGALAQKMLQLRLSAENSP